METPPGQVIRTLREALQMSQAELARALDWSASTISSWERGRAEPSRLAFKIILAFAEERGVRYREKPVTQALVPVGRAPVALPAIVPRERFVAVSADRPRWSVEATFRLTRPVAATGERRSVSAAVSTFGIAAATLCAAVALGLPGSARHSAPAAAGTLREATPTAGRERAVPRVAEPAPALVSAGAAERIGRATAPITPIARLDGLLLVGDRHQATFHTDDDTVTVPEGSHLGAQRIATITRDQVELIGPHGDIRTVRLGHRAALQ